MQSVYAKHSIVVLAAWEEDDIFGRQHRPSAAPPVMEAPGLIKVGIADHPAFISRWC